MRELIFILFSFISFQSIALDLKIRLFSTQNLTSAIVNPDTGSYYLLALNSDLQKIDTILDIFPEEENREISFIRYGKNVLVKKGDKSLGNFEAVLVKSKHSRKEFRIEAGGKSRVYHGDLQLRIFESFLQIVNNVNLENYVAGVVESEGGHLDSPEFFKAQAVLARTFALKNIEKHARDGYNLKDDVTSQVYFSRARSKYRQSILDAVSQTEDTVIVLADCRPILGVFHANSGGCLVNSEDAWSKPISYLRTKPDPYSVGQRSYEWERKIGKDEFYGYVAHSLGVRNDIQLRKAVLNYNPEPRRGYFEYQGKRLKLTSFRRQFNLRSTYFQVTDGGGNYLILKGRGYGHGVGLSQDGAIEMARRGFSYREILLFYFEGVELENLNRLNLES